MVDGLINFYVKKGQRKTYVNALWFKHLQWLKARVRSISSIPKGSGCYAIDKNPKTFRWNDQETPIS